MAAGDDLVCKLVAARGPNPAAWGFSTADPGVSEESAKNCEEFSKEFVAEEKKSLKNGSLATAMHWFVF